MTARLLRITHLLMPLAAVVLVVAVLKPEDLPLVRRVRRKFISAANPHATEYYDSFTKILLTFVLRTETLK
jgi:hypothetical protein